MRLTWADFPFVTVFQKKIEIHVPLLNISQRTSFRLVQFKKHLTANSALVQLSLHSLIGHKYSVMKRKTLITSIFSISDNLFYSVLFQGLENQGGFGHGISWLPYASIIAAFRVLETNTTGLLSTTCYNLFTKMTLKLLTSFRVHAFAANNYFVYIGYIFFFSF